MKKGGLIAVVLIAAACTAVVLPKVLKPKEAAKEIPAPVVTVEQPEYGNIELFRNLTGTVEPSDVVYIYPKMAGEVTDLYVKTGDVVEEGQLLCIIDTDYVESARLNMEAARTALQDAQTNLRRQQVLYASGDISSLAWEQAQTTATNAQIQYDSAKLNYDNQMEYSHITATIGGTVESFNIQLHDMVSQQSLICVVSGQGSKAVTFYVPEKLMEHLSVGGAVEIEKNGTVYQAVITELSTMLDSDTGLFKVKASVEDGNGLPTGSTVKLSVTSDKADQAMTVPVDSIYYEGGDAYVYLYDNGTVHQVPVEVGIYDSQRAQILSGIDRQDQVITAWSSELYEGSLVQLADAEAAGSSQTEAAGSGKTGAADSGKAEAADSSEADPAESGAEAEREGR